MHSGGDEPALTQNVGSPSRLSLQVNVDLRKRPNEIDCATISQRLNA